MKNTLLKAVTFTATLLCALNLNAQSVLKIGDEFDTNISINQKKYKEIAKTKFQNKSTASTKKEVIFEKDFFSSGAAYVKLYFENFDLAPGDYLEIIGDSTGESIIYAEKGKIVDQNKTMISNFWSRVMLDDKVTVKLYSSGNIGKHVGFEIKKVAYGYSEVKIAKQLKAAQSQKAICSNDDKESIACYDGTEMFEKAKAVCRLLIGGSSLCTGWLLGSEGNLMTNNHCIGSVSDAQNTDFMFNYQYTNCSETNNATTDIVASSSTFIKTSSSLDYTLVQLPVNPTGTYGYLSLSSAIPSAGDRIYIPQHPGGRRKEISVVTDSGGTSNGFSSVFDTNLNNSQSVRYLADTEGGSSGSPVLDFNSNLVIAIHNTGGCPNGSYGRSDELITSIGADMPNDGVDGGGVVNPPNTSDCTSTVNSFPYSESFESGDGWTQATGDDGNWINDASGTPSSNTGPSAGADGSFYMFLEASTNNSAGQIGSNATAILVSPCFDLSSESEATFSFENHMYGTSVGSLALQISTNGTNWTTLWSLSGNQGNQWNAESVSLNAYTGNSEVRLRFSGTTGTSWSSDIAIDAISLTTDGDGGSSDTECDAIDFNDFSITSFSNQDSAGNFSVNTNGTTLNLSNNTWKYIPFDYTVTENTVIEFEFSSTSQGEIHGIGFENDNELTAGNYFKVYGTQNYGITNYDNYTSGTATYVIPVGDSYTGTMDRLVFINDNDAGSGNTSTFSNVKIYETSCSESLFEVAFGSRVDVLGNEDENIFSTIKIAPNPIKKGSALTVFGLNDNTANTSYTIINILGQVLEKNSFTGTNKTINTAKFETGIYILKIENEFAKVNKRFIIKE